MSKKIIILSVMVMALLIMTVGCYNTGAKPRVTVPDRVDIRGKITKTDKASGHVAAILVEGKIEKDTSVDKAYIRVTNETEIYQSTTNKKRSRDDLQEGQEVEALFTGPVAESYPVQATARVIRIISKGSP